MIVSPLDRGVAVSLLHLQFEYTAEMNEPEVRAARPRKAGLKAENALEHGHGRLDTSNVQLPAFSASPLIVASTYSLDVISSWLIGV